MITFEHCIVVNCIYYVFNFYFMLFYETYTILMYCLCSLKCFNTRFIILFEPSYSLTLAMSSLQNYLGNLWKGFEYILKKGFLDVHTQWKNS